MNSRPIVTFSRALHSHSFLHYRNHHGLSAFHRHVAANKVKVVMTAGQMSKTLTTASTAAGAPDVSSSSPSSSLPPNPALFAVDVVKMDRKELNRLDLKTIPSWARSIIDQERCRRKKQELEASKLKTESAATTSIAITATTTATVTTPDAAIIVASASAAKPTFKLDLPAEKSDLALTEFRDKLLKMDRKDLNMIEMKSTPSWARSLINTERCSRKRMDTIVKSTPKPLPAVKVKKAAFKLDLPAEKSDSALAELKHRMQEMSRKDLSKVDMKATPSWARRPINDELCSRKKTKTIVESTTKSLASSLNTTEARVETPSVVTTADASTVTTISDSSSGSGSDAPSAQGKKLQDEEQKKSKEKENYRRGAGTGDGFSLHGNVAAEAAKETSLLWNCDIIYDPSLKKSESHDDDIESRDRDMFGRFCCSSCRTKHGRRQGWNSAEVFTQFWFKYVPANGRAGSKDTLRYQSLIHFQKCRGCEEYMHAKLDQESYVKKAIKAFEIWAERRDRKNPDNDFESYRLRKPHDSARCHGCIAGLHRPEDHDHNYSNSYLRKIVPRK